MSSNIKIQRICQFCGREFTARTTVTQTCSDICAKKLYKLKQKTAKIEKSNQETRSIINQSIENLRTKEYLTVREVAQIINCSRQTVYSLIREKKLTAFNIKVKKTLIKQTEINNLFSYS